MLARYDDSTTRTASSFHGGFLNRIPIETLDHTRDIALLLLRSFVDRPSYVLGITSALRDEGKTTIGLGLAEVMATDFGVETVLLDMHAEHPWPSMAGEPMAKQGLSDWLSGECSLSDALVHIHDRCSVLPFGRQSLTSRDVLQYMVKVNAIRQLREQHGLILLDLPDLMNPAAGALADQCDGLCLVIRSGVTPVDSVTDVLPLLQNVTIHGAILNRHRSAVPAAIRSLFS